MRAARKSLCDPMGYGGLRLQCGFDLQFVDHLLQLLIGLVDSQSGVHKSFSSVAASIPMKY